MGDEGEEEHRNGGRDCVLQPHQNQMEKSAKKFKSGDQVEVSFERDEEYGVWFPATVIKYLSDDNSYLVQHFYKKDSTVSVGSVQKSTVRSSKIRPQSPSDRKRSFRLWDTVDAFYDFAWTTGVIVKDYNDKKFMVSFKRTDNKMVFSETKLRFHMEWVDGRWVDASQLKVAASTVSPLAACKTGAAKATTATKEDAFEEPKTPITPVLLTDATVSKRQTRSRVADNDATRFKPLKKSKSENAAEVTTFSACKTDAAKETTVIIKQDPPQELKTPADATASRRSIGISSLETDSSVGEKVTEGENVKGLKKDTVRSRKRKGRPLKFCPLSMEGNESNEVASTAEDKNEKGCETEDIAHIILAIAEKGTNIPPDIVPCGFNEDGSQTFFTDQNGQGNDPSGLVDKTKGENIKELESDTLKSYKSREIPPKICLSSTRGNDSNTDVKTAEDTAEKGCEIEHNAPNNLALVHIKQSQTSISDQNGEGIDPTKLLLEENRKKNQREMSIELLGPVEISTKSRENADMDIDVNQTLPFEKTVSLWDALESLEVFKSIPQKPHFRPLESSNEDCREGLALGHTVTFLKIASKIPKLQLNTPRSSIENSLKNLVVLEDNGFDVKLVSECLNDLLLRKDKIEKLQNDLKVCDGEILEYENKKADIGKVVAEFDKMLEEIRAKRDVAVLEMEVQESGLARSQSTWDKINKHMMTIESDFKKIAVLPVRK